MFPCYDSFDLASDMCMSEYARVCMCVCSVRIHQCKKLMKKTLTQAFHRFPKPLRYNKKP